MAELASLVLAVPPLMALWLEHYRECCDMYRTWRSFRPEYRRFQTQVGSVRIRLELLQDKLLIPIVDSEEQLAELKANRSLLEQRLEERLLSDVRPVLIDVMVDAHEALERLSKTLGEDNEQLETLIADRLHLGASMPGLLGRLSARARNELLRAKFSTSKGPREKAFADICQRLDNFSTLLTSNDEILELKTAMKRRQTVQVKPLLSFWRHAKRLHSLLSSCWPCECSQLHRADLQLVHRTQHKVRLNLDLLYSLSPIRSSPWQRVQARVVPHEGRDESSTVTFADEATLPLITDMCRILGAATPSSSGGRLGIDNDQYEVSLNNKAKRLPTTPREMMTLQQLLLNHSLDRSQRHQLAIIIASSQVQLHSTGWLSGPWTASEIYFKTTTAGPELESPYLRHNLSVVSQGHPSFESLGIVLLELCFDRLISDCGIEAASSSMKARLWVEKVVGETGELYAEAIEWCLGRQWVRENSNWREDFYDNVVDKIEQTTKTTWPAR